MPSTTDPDGRIAAAVKRYRGDPAYAPGQTVGGRLICGARRKNNTPCQASPVPDATRCGNHGGKSPRSVAAAERRRAEQELEQTVRTLGIRDAYPDIDPGEALLEEIRVTHAHVQWLRGKVAELEPEALVWGRTQHEEGTGPEGYIDKTTEAAKPSIWYELYERERERLAKFCAAAIKAGIEERKVRLAEQQGELVATVLRRILDNLNLTPTQWETAQQVVPRELRAIEGGAA